jgi:Protein of unknown function (DUF1592)/Protein of unknown function (DUF1588)/Protein of unknown function (DUF1587)/Protein of unknown function (DUF1585)/Ca-dependent carbohydrate-binding module xylan-binding/Protein of unknown function (DUF1595)
VWHQKTIIVTLALVCTCLLGWARPTTKSRSEVDFSRDVRPYLENHCLECHSGADPKGDFDIEPLLDEKLARNAFDDWDYIRERVQYAEMPPRSRRRPNAKSTDALVAWIDQVFGEIAPELRLLDPGRPILRRLNHREFRSTVADWLAVDFPAEEFFPAETVGHGFDHIGASLTMPDALFEKYLEAAEEIAAKALPLWRPDQISETLYDSSSLSGRDLGDAIGLSTQSATTARHFFPRDGRYQIRVSSYGQQAGPENCRMAVQIDGQTLQTFEVSATRGEAGLYSAEIEIEAGQRLLGAAFLNDYYRPSATDPQQRDRNLFVKSLLVRGPLNPPPASSFQVKYSQQFPESLGVQRLRLAVSELASLAWRRPAKASELDRLLTALPSEAPYSAQLQHALVLLLVSPDFLFRQESDRKQLSEREQSLLLEIAAGQPLVDRVRPLNAWELATRLSYFLWSSAPDTELRQLAASGELLNPKVLHLQTDRLLRSKHSRRLVENFAGQWLQLRNLSTVQFDELRFPTFDAELKQAAQLESLAFFQAFLNQDLDLRDLLVADFSFVNARLAEHYGLAPLEGSQLRKVSLTPSPRQGLLGQASILALTSNPSRTSPVKRGKWVLDNLLGEPPAPPPANAGDLGDNQATASAASLRIQLADHRADRACAVCHDSMDPLGLGLEHFGPTGAWRAEDQELPIDASGVLPDGTHFDGLKELSQILRNDPAFPRTLVTKLYVYALGRGLERSDRMILDSIQAAMEPDRPTLRQAIHGIVGSAAFRLRRTRP